jgi:hypothetical protein
MISKRIQVIGLLELAVLGRDSPVVGEALESLALDRDETTDLPFGVAGVIAAPISPGVPCRAGVDAVSELLDYWPFAKISNADLKWGNRVLPIRSARRRIPLAAFGLKKYLDGTSPVSMTSNNEDSLA